MENEIITYVKKDINAERMAFLASKFGFAPLYLSYSDYEEATEEERESVFGVELWCEADLREALEALDIDPVWTSEYGSYKCKSGGTDALILLDVKSAEEYTEVVDNLLEDIYADNTMRVLPSVDGANIAMCYYFTELIGDAVYEASGATEMGGNCHLTVTDNHLNIKWSSIEVDDLTKEETDALVMTAYNDILTATGLLKGNINLKHEE